MSKVGRVIRGQGVEAAGGPSGRYKWERRTAPLREALLQGPLDLHVWGSGTGSGLGLYKEDCWPVKGVQCPVRVPTPKDMMAFLRALFMHF